MEQAWFEMRDVRKRRLSDAVWIPLRSATRDASGHRGRLGYKSEFFGAGSIAVPLADRDKANQCGWSDIGLIHDQRSYAFENSYKPADIYQRRDEEDMGLELVLHQSFDGAEPSVWHLHQDLVIALGLLREGDVWVCPHEGYVTVAQLKRNSDNTIASIEIRAEFLRDYLAARRMALRVATYRSREAVLESDGHITWPDGLLREGSDDDLFEGRVQPIHEGGASFGSRTAVFHMRRTDVDPEADIPAFGAPDGNNTDGRSWVVQQQGRKLQSVSGEIWRNEWVEPAAYSVRVRGDKVPTSCFFITDASGMRESADALNNEDVGRWLWFAPRVVEAIAERRGGSLNWYTRETGGVQALPGYEVHFGLNSKDLVTVYAYDIARLPEWQKRIWAGFNVSPDGKVSRELLAAQMEGEPAETEAPEVMFKSALARVDKVFQDKWKAPLFRKHQDTDDILRKIHRFRATDRAGLLALAKDLARLTADSIDVDLLHKIVPLEKSEKRGSIKSLEKVLAKIVSAEEARRTMGPLVGVYDLRLGDAHLPSSKIDDAFDLVGINQSLPPLQQGLCLLEVTANTLGAISKIFVDASSTSP